MRRRLTILSICLLAVATPGVAQAAIDPETNVALDTGEHGMAAYGRFVMNPAEARTEVA